MFDTAHAHIFDFLILNLERFMFYIYLFAEDVLLICTKHRNKRCFVWNNDNNNLKWTLETYYTYNLKILKGISEIFETTEKKLANAKIAVIFNNTYLNIYI